MKVSVIIVNWNAGDVLKESLLSILNERELIKNVFVVDNNSTDGSVDGITELDEKISLMENGRNLGYSKAVNRVLQQKDKLAEYILVMNPDVVLYENTLTNLINYMQRNQDVGMSGPKILNPDGSLQPACRRSIPTPEIAFYRISGLSKIFKNSRIFSKYNLTYLDENKHQFVEAVSGSFMFIRKKALEVVGTMDEKFFMYGEDLDWCYRFTKAGWKVAYCPDARVLHYHRVSSKKRLVRSTFHFYEAMHLFYSKHFKRRNIADWAITGSIILLGTAAVTASVFKKMTRKMNLIK